ncbi:MAG: YraN family protein [Proteobacteria bacterium]|nr:YraN family protein [Pseudomonadota bacterium]
MKPNQRLQKRNNAHQYGLTSENLASSYMHSQGYITVHQRYKCSYGELDLICHNSHLNTLVFVEVKARKKLPDRPIINYKQIARTCAAAGYFLSQHPHFASNHLRFDYIVICRNQIALHLENAWEYLEPAV